VKLTYDLILPTEAEEEAIAKRRFPDGESWPVRPGQEWRVDLYALVWCCDKLRELHSDDHAVFGDEYRNMGLLCLANRYYMGGELLTDLHPIDFCPFCGQKVEYERRRTLRKLKRQVTVTEQVTRTRTEVAYEEVQGQ
jgi:hypothetical protein